MLIWVRLFYFMVGFSAVASIAHAEEKTQKSEQSPQLIMGSFFGPQLLSEDEQAAYRARIRSAKSAQESESIRAEHYELMKARAKEKGFALPEKRQPVGGSTGSLFGPELMTEEERAAYRAKIRSAKTKEAFEQIVTERNVENEARARDGGIALTDAQTTRTGSNGSILGAFFGPQLMSEEEQVAYRARLRGAKSQEERDRIRAEHQRQLQTRAREKGIVLPD